MVNMMRIRAAEILRNSLLVLAIVVAFDTLPLEGAPATLVLLGVWGAPTLAKGGGLRPPPF